MCDTRRNPLIIPRFYKVALFGVILASLLLAGCSATEDPVFTSTTVTSGSVNATLTDAVEIADNQTVIIKGSDNQTPLVDDTTDALVGILFPHHEIHAGNSYILTDVTDIANGATRDLLLVTANTTEWVHFWGSVEIELEATVYFYEGTTYSDNGTALTSNNRDRNSTNTAGMLVYHTPTVAATGDPLYHAQLGSGKKAGGGQRDGNEIILKQNTAYLLRVTNETGNDNAVFIKLDWYEHTND